MTLLWRWLAQEVRRTVQTPNWAGFRKHSSWGQDTPILSTRLTCQLKQCITSGEIWFVHGSLNCWSSGRGQIAAAQQGNYHLGLNFLWGMWTQTPMALLYWGSPEAISGNKKRSRSEKGENWRSIIILSTWAATLTLPSRGVWIFSHWNGQSWCLLNQRH